MSFSLRDELASRLFVDCAGQDRLAIAGTDKSPADATTLARNCLALAQDFVDAVCTERGHDFKLERWLEGHAPSQQGRASGAPRGMWSCQRCGREEERSGA